MCLVAGFIVGLNFNTNNEINITASPALTSISPSANKITPSPSVSDKYATWETYSNSDYGYTIKYPKNAKIEYGVTDLQDPNTPEGLCATITTTYGYINILARIDEENPIICGRTGVGNDYVNLPAEKVFIGDTEYSATGMEMDTATEYDAFWHVKLTSGQQIEFGITSKDPSAKEDVLNILKSFKLE